MKESLDTTIEGIYFIGISKDEISINFPIPPPCMHLKEKEPLILPRKEYEITMWSNTVERIESSQRQTNIYLEKPIICDIRNHRIICQKKSE